MESPFDWNLATPTPLQKLESDFLKSKAIHLYVKRDDLIHPQIQGNKWRKLKYNFLEAHQRGLDTILTFGGAYSNHIAATAAAARLNGFKAIGIIRGDELHPNANATLRQAAADGMRLVFVSREAYRNKAQLIKTYSNATTYAIPEGGSNALAAKGAAEIYTEIAYQLDTHPDFVTVPFGTGGTAGGLLRAMPVDVKLLVMMAIKFNKENAQTDILQWQTETKPPTNLLINDNYHFGGYANTVFN